MATPVASFGPGIAIIRRTDLAVGPIFNVGYIQEFTLDFAGTIKELFGQNQFPLVAARGTIKATGKFKAAVISGLAWNNCFFGNTFTAGNVNWAIGESHAIPTTPFQVTIAPPGGGAFNLDLGVTYQATGLPLQRAATASAAGIYAVNEATGIYTFNTADSGLTALFTYAYTQAAVGQTLNVINSPIGTTPTFQLDYYTNLNQPASKPFIVRVFSCVAAKIALASKLEDYIMPDFDFSFFANNSGQVANLYYPEVS
jgi:hypothetical protein